MNRHSIFARVRSDFSLFWGAHTLSQFGSQITLLALPLTAVVLLDADEWQMGVLGAAGTAPFLLFGLFAGVIVDRVRRRYLMIAMDIVRALLMMAVPLLAWADLLTLQILYLITFLASTATLFFDVSYQAYLPTLVASDQLVRANGRLEASTSAATVAGPGLTGFFVKLLSAPVALLIDGMSFVVSALALSMIRSKEVRPIAVPLALWREIGEGLSFVIRQRLIRYLTLCTAIWFVGWQIFSVSYVAAAKRWFDLDEASLGLTIGAQGAGALIAATIAGRLAARYGVGLVLIGGAGICALGGLFIATANRDDAALVLVIGQFFIGFGSTSYYINHVSLRQAVTERALLGRVNATVRFMTWGIQPFAALAGGWIGSHWGLQGALTAAALVFGLALAPLLAGRLIQVRAMPLAAQES